MGYIYKCLPQFYPPYFKHSILNIVFQTWFSGRESGRQLPHHPIEQKTRVDVSDEAAEAHFGGWAADFDEPDAARSS